MLTQYERMLTAYKNWYPNLYERTVECRPSSRYCILAILNDGSRVEFNSLDNTIRDVTRLYSRNVISEMNEEVWRKEFGRKLRRAIIERGISQEILSGRTGISRQMLSRYVSGNSTPSGYILSRLAEALECDVREFTNFGYIDE